MEIKNRLFSKTGMTAFFTGLILVFVFAPLIVRQTPAPFWFQENFFNTLQIAENFKRLGFPTFDGVTPSNDFSPVWTAVLAGLSFLVSSACPVFFILVRAVLGLALGITLLLFNRLIGALDFKPEPQERFLTLSFLTAAFIYTAATGSDAALAIPCIFFNALCLLKALRLPCFKTAVFYGLSLFLCALVRFDSMAFSLTAALVFYFQFNRKNPITAKQLLALVPGLVIALIPLMIWADMLQSTFGSPVPAEIASWTKTQDHSPWRLFVVLFIEPLRYIRQMPGALEALTFPVLILGLTAYASFPWIEREQTPADTVFYALIWYPILYLMVISAVTFIALPEYAFYPLAAGGPAALLFAVCRIDRQLQEKEKATEKKQALTVWLILGLCFCCSAVFLSLRARSAFYKPVTQAIAEFTGKNPGRYAMSGGAGITSYITKTPFVRLDGMAQDQKMLDFLNTQTDLNTVLKHYGVNYLVTANSSAGGKKCYSAREPGQNRFGGSNKGMSDWLCAPPVFEKQATPKIKISIFKIDQNGKAIPE